MMRLFGELQEQRSLSEIGASATPYPSLPLKGGGEEIISL
jgi:hypothetical protein